MSSPHISTLPLILTSLLTHLPLVTLLTRLPPTATHSLTCLPSSSSIEVPSDGELEVQCNVTVPNTQEAFYTIQWVTNKKGMISNVSYNYICSSDICVLNSIASVAGSSPFF